MTVLLVDDDKHDVETFELAVREIDSEIRVRTAASALDALQLLAADGKQGKGFPHFIFIDINMPLMNGIEFLEILKDEIHIQGTCVTMYTTTAKTEEIERCRRLGAEYITKPFEFDELVGKLKKSFTRIGSC